MKNILLFISIINSFFAFSQIRDKNFINIDKEKTILNGSPSLLPFQKQKLFQNRDYNHKELSKETEKKEQKNALQINLLPLFVNSYNLFYERKVANKISVTLALNYYYAKSWYFKYHDSQWFSTTVDFRWYLSKQPINGVFIGPYLKFRYIKDYAVVSYLQEPSASPDIETITQNEHWYYSGFGLITGYQKIFNSGVTLGFFGGGGYYPIEILKTRVPQYSMKKGLRADIRTGFTTGYAF